MGSGRFRDVECRFELAERQIASPFRQKNHSQVDIGSGQLAVQRDGALQVAHRFAVAALLPIGHPERRARLGQGGVEARRLLEFGNRLGSLAAVPERQAKVVACFRRGRFEFHRLAEVANRAIEIPLSAKQVAQIAVRRREAREECQGLGQLGTGGLDIAGIRGSPGCCQAVRRWPGLSGASLEGPPRAGRNPLQRLAQPVIGLRLLRIEAERSLVRGRGLARIAGDERLADLVVDLGERRRGEFVGSRAVLAAFQDLAELPDRERAFPDRSQRDSQVHPDLEVVRVQGDGPPEGADGRFGLAGLGKQRCQAVVGPYEVGVELGRAAETGDRTREFLALLVGDAQPVLGERRARVPLHQILENLDRTPPLPGPL